MVYSEHLSALDSAGHICIHLPGLSYDGLEKTGAIKIENVEEPVSQLLKTNAHVVAIPDAPYEVGMLR